MVNAVFTNTRQSRETLTTIYTPTQESKTIFKSIENKNHYKKTR
jgi:hypothetical protein